MKMKSKTKNVAHKAFGNGILQNSKDPPTLQLKISLEVQDLSGVVMSIITMKMLKMVLTLARMMIMLNLGTFNLAGEQCYQREGEISKI